MQDDFTFERDQSRVQRLDHFHRDEQRRAQWPHTSRLFLHPYLNKSDCETGLYLGIVLGEQRAWPRAAEALIETVACFEKADAKLNDEIANIRASTQPLPT